MNARTDAHVASSRLGWTLLAAVVLVAFWHAMTALFGIVSPARFPMPAEVVASMQQIVVDGYSNGRWHEHVLRSVLLVVNVIRI